MLAALGIRDLFQLLRQIEIIPADNAVLDVDGEARSLPYEVRDAPTVGRHSSIEWTLDCLVIGTP